MKGVGCRVWGIGCRVRQANLRAAARHSWSSSFPASRSARACLVDTIDCRVDTVLCLMDAVDCLVDTVGLSGRVCARS